MNADIVLVGAGIAGLRCGIELLRKRPSLRIVMLEKYNYTGGRVVSYKKTIEDVKGRCSHVQWENGAGRIHSDHRHVLELVQRYNLTTIPLDDTLYFEDESVLTKNIFTDSMRLLSQAIEELPSQNLSTKTLRQILISVLGESTANSFLLQFPYRAEVDTLRADLALESFRDEMGTYKGYVVVKEGLSALIEGMRKEFETRGGTLFHGQDVKNITKQGSLLLVEAQTDAGPVVWEAPTVICCLHRDACAELPVFKGWDVLSHLQMEPLVRTYAVFPTNKGTTWFTGLPKIASASPLRFFIPMDPSCGTVMLSYTDGKDARQVLKMLDKYGEEKTGDLLVGQARRSFPDRTIPDPLFFKAHPWTSGCTYWLPGNYDPSLLSKDALKPFPDWNLFCCGESFSLRQAWMEGALEHADLLLETYF